MTRPRRATSSIGRSTGRRQRRSAHRCGRPDELHPRRGVRQQLVRVLAPGIQCGGRQRTGCQQPGQLFPDPGTRSESNQWHPRGVDRSQRLSSFPWWVGNGIVDGGNGSDAVGATSYAAYWSNSTQRPANGFPNNQALGASYYYWTSLGFNVPYPRYLWAEGKGADGSLFWFYTLTPGPDMTGAITFSNILDGAMTLSWPAQAGANGYRVWKSETAVKPTDNGSAALTFAPDVHREHARHRNHLLFLGRSNRPRIEQRAVERRHVGRAHPRQREDDRDIVQLDPRPAPSPPFTTPPSVSPRRMPRRSHRARRFTTGPTRAPSTPPPAPSGVPDGSFSALVTPG